MFLIRTLAILAFAVLAQGYVVPPATLAAAPYPDWAHYHWIWYAHGGNGSADLLQLATDYLAHNISVGAVDVDSTWETGFNDFTPTTSMYPNMTQFIDSLHGLNIRVIFWITSMVDTDSPNYQEGDDMGYYIKGPLGKSGLMNWWHGKGSLIDYTSAEALAWWHAQMDIMLRMNIDGWKCDGTDPYIMELVEPQSSVGPITYREYADSYYGDFFNYTRNILGDDRIIMSRPCDNFGPIYLKFSPKFVMTSGWVGDDDDTFEGLQSALDSYLQSAWAGYANFGSDIGGYRLPVERTSDLFLRWAQLGAFSPLMENGGNGEHRPWEINQTQAVFDTDVYRTFVNIHYSLVPYLLTTGTNALEKGISSLTPLAPHNETWEIIVDLFRPEYYDYLLGDDILVSPIINNMTAPNLTRTKVHFLEGANWAYWFDNSKIYKGENKTVELDIPLSEFSVFQRVGAIIPMNMSLVEPNHDNIITMSIIALQLGHHSSEMREFRGSGLVFDYTLDDNNTFVFRCSAHSTKRVYLKIDQIMTIPQSVFLTTPDQQQQEILLDSSSSPGYQMKESTLYIDTGSLVDGVIVTIHGLDVVAMPQ